MSNFQDYSLEPEEELESKLKFFYTNYNEKIQYQKCMNFEDDEDANEYEILFFLERSFSISY
jgi:hypothetical protein